MSDLYQIVPLIVRGDERGSLVAIEEMADVPFEVRRVFYIYGTRAETRRGLHAHRVCRQMVVCVNGSCRFTLDDGVQVSEVQMHASRPEGLLVEPMIWHEMHDFSPECILMVLASLHYDEADYIRDYDEFVSLSTTGD